MFLPNLKSAASPFPEIIAIRGSKIFNLCDPDPPTSQTDRQTDGQTEDDMQSQYRALHCSASRGNKLRFGFVKSATLQWKVYNIIVADFSDYSRLVRTGLCGCRNITVHCC